MLLNTSVQPHTSSDLRELTARKQSHLMHTEEGGTGKGWTHRGPPTAVKHEEREALAVQQLGEEGYLSTDNQKSRDSFPKWPFPKEW